MQSKQWKHHGSPPPKKFKTVHSAGKVMSSIFWYSQGVIMIDYLEQCHMINGAFLCRRIEAALRQEARKTDSRCSALAGQRPYPNVIVDMTAATECGFEILPRPPYSPDKAPSDFYPFPKLKFHLCGTQYGSNEGVTDAVNKYLGDQENALYFEGIRKLEQ